MSSSNHFIRGKACSDYIEKLDHLRDTPIKILSLNDDSFTNWVIDRHPVHTAREIWNDGILEMQDG